MMFVCEYIDEVGYIDDCFFAYVFVFLIALFEYLPLLFCISNMSSILDVYIACPICRDDGNDGLVSTRDCDEGPATKTMRILSRVRNAVTEWLLGYGGGFIRLIQYFPRYVRF